MRSRSCLNVGLKNQVCILYTCICMYTHAEFIFTHYTHIHICTIHRCTQSFMHANVFRTQCSFLSKAAIQKENKPFPMKKKVSFKLPTCNLLVSSSQKRREGSQLKVYAALAEYWSLVPSPCLMAHNSL